MPDKTKFELRKPITPYICSTPLDFSEERRHLSNEVFPKLNELCKLRGSYFDPADLCWMPGDRDAQRGLLLKNLLDAVRRCSPFFLCLLGETYGPYRNENNTPLAQPKKWGRFEVLVEHDWLDKNFLVACAGSHPWVLQEGHQYRSITELEVIQGALVSDSQYVTLYYRQSDHLEDKLLCSSGSLQDRSEIISMYCAESEEARLKIHDLRQRLVNKGVPVKYFRTLEELGSLVLEDWLQIIDILLPPLLHDFKLLDMAEYTEWLAQDSFANSHSEAFVQTPEVEEVLQQLTDFATSCTRADVKGGGHDILVKVSSTDRNGSHSLAAKYTKLGDQNSSIMLLTGGRGVGKSTLSVHWLSEFKKDNPHISVISHFVSASKKSADIIYILCQCITTLRRQHFLSETCEPNSICGDMEAEFYENNFPFLCEAFVAAIGLAPCVILVDGVNELNSHREFDWLPEYLPTTCKLIFTTTCSDISHRCLSQRHDTTVVSFPVSLTETSATVAMIEAHMPNLRQLIGGEQAVKRLALCKIVQTALGSRVIGSEIACYRVYSKMESFMEVYTEMWSLRDFWSMCVRNWVEEYSWKPSTHSPEFKFEDDGFDYTGWVMDSLCLIAISRNGLAQSQILNILKNIGYEGDHEVTNYYWLQFRLAAGITLQELGDGRLVFGHKYLQEIAEYHLLRSIPSFSCDPETIMRSAGTGRRCLYHEVLARFFSHQEVNVQVLQELPWHLMLSGDVTGLVNCLTNCQILLKMSADHVFWQQDLKLFWSVCELSGHHPDLVYLQLMHDLIVVDIQDVQISDNLKAKDSANSIFLTQVGTGTICQPQALSVTQNKENFAEVSYVCWYLAKFLIDINKRKAGSILLSSLINYLQQNCPLTTEMYLLQCRCYCMKGKLYSVSENKTAAEIEYKLALHSLMAAIDIDDELTYQNQTLYLKGLLLNFHGDIHIHKNQLFEAEELLKEALDCVMDLSGCVVLKSTIYFNMGILKSNAQDYQAQFCLCESEKLRRQWFGHNHPLVAEVLLALARLLVTSRNIKGQNVKQAEKMYRQALSIQEKCFGPGHLLVAEVLFEVGRLLAKERGRPAKLEAQRYLRQSLDIRTTHLGGNHPLTVVTQQCLTKLDVALQVGNYEFGLVKSPEQRSKKMPFSSLTLREHDLSIQQNRTKSPATSRLDDSGYFHSVSREGTLSHSIPDKIRRSMISLTSASERLLSAPSVEVPRLLHRKRESLYDQYRSTHLCASHQVSIGKNCGNLISGGVESTEQNGTKNDNADIVIDGRILNGNSENDTTITNIGTDSGKVANGDLKDLDTADFLGNDETAGLLKGNNEDSVDTPRIESYANITARNNPPGRKKMVSVRSSSAPRQLFEKFGSGRLGNRPQSCLAKSRSACSFQHNPRSGRSSSMTIASSSTGGHLSHCIIPGPHDITLGNSQTIAGPHSCLTSLLGDPPCPRQISNTFYHRAAWYHVPGRYPTLQELYPRKRMQRTKNARELEAFIALRSQWMKSGYPELEQCLSSELQ